MATPRYLCLLFSPPLSDISPLAEACYRFTPKIALRGNEAIFLEIGGSLRLFHSEQALLRRVHALCRRLLAPLPALPSHRLGVGESPSQALLNILWPPTTTSFEQTERVRADPSSYPYHLVFSPPVVSPQLRSFVSFYKDHSHLPLLALTIMLHPFTPLASDHPLRQMLSQLAVFGVKDLVDLKNLPVKSLTARFGEVGHQAYRALDQLPFTPWPQFVCEEKIVVSLEIDTLSQSMNWQFSELLFYLKQLVDALAARLFARALKVQSWMLTLHEDLTHQDHQPKTRLYIFDLPIPQSSPSQILRIMQERLHRELQKQPLSGPLQSIKVAVLQTAPLRRLQRDFLTDSEQEEESLGSLLARLQQRLGQHRVFVAEPQARYLPEKSWKAREPNEFCQSRKAQDVGSPCTSHSFATSAEEKTNPDGMRPTRLLAKPCRLQRVGSWLKCSLGNWQIQGWQGPERMSGEWWHDFFARDYYKVTTPRGGQIWIFQDPHKRQFYLHGFFD